MAGPKALLVTFLITFANAKLINGQPLGIDGDFNIDEQINNNYEEQYGAASNVSALVYEGGLDEMDSSSFDYEKIEDSESNVSQGSQSVTKGMNFGGNNYNTGGGMNFGGNNYNSRGSELSLSTYGGGVVHLSNMDIDETISGLTSTTSSMYDKRMFIGEIEGNGKKVWSDNPKQIVIIENNKCEQRTYDNLVRVSSEVLSSAECAKVFDKVRQMKADAEKFKRDLAQRMFEKQQAKQQNKAGRPNNKPSASNTPPASNKPYASNTPSPINKPTVSNTPFGNNWPFGPINNPFAPNNGNSGNNGDSGRRKSRRTSRRRVPYQPDVLNSYFN